MPLHFEITFYRARFLWLVLRALKKLEVLVEDPLGYSKKKQTGKGGWGHTFLKPPKEFLGVLVYPWKFQTKQGFTSGNSTKFCYTPRKLYALKPRPLEILRFFLDHSWKSQFLIKSPENLLSISSIPLEMPHPQPPSPFFFLWNSPLPSGSGQTLNIYKS